MRHQLVYDLPTRIFHWLFVVLFLSAFAIAKTVDDETVLFVFHMLSGLSLSFLVVLRVIWGFIGTRHARFDGFALNPKHLVAYFAGILTGSRRKWPGHNPASSWAALTMMAFALGLGVTGYLMTAGPDKEVFEDLHELLADALLITAVLHVSGVLFHSLRHRDGLAFSMVDGRKQDIAPEESISSPRTFSGILLLALFSAFTVQIVRHYDAQQGTLSFFGATLQLGEEDS